MLSHAQLLQILSYNPETGVLTWIAPRKGIRVGQRAGSPDASGYIAVTIDRQKYGAHRLAWFYMTGEWPPHEIDHEDGNEANNRWANLRAATHQQNMTNRRKHTPGLKGATFDRRRKRWFARICANGRRTHLGTFSTEKEAHDAYCMAAKQQHGAFFRAS